MIGNNYQVKFILRSDFSLLGQIPEVSSQNREKIMEIKSNSIQFSDDWKQLSSQIYFKVRFYFRSDPRGFQTKAGKIHGDHVKFYSILRFYFRSDPRGFQTKAGKIH